MTSKNVLSPGQSEHARNLQASSKPELDVTASGSMLVCNLSQVLRCVTVRVHQRQTRPGHSAAHQGSLDRPDFAKYSVLHCSTSSSWFELLLQA
jgi:hypothetical protein